MTQPKGWDSEHLERIQRYSRPSTGTDRPLRDGHHVDTEGTSPPFYGQNGMVTHSGQGILDEWWSWSKEIQEHLPCGELVETPLRHLHLCKIKLSHRAPDTL